MGQTMLQDARWVVDGDRHCADQFGIAADFLVHTRMGMGSPGRRSADFAGLAFDSCRKAWEVT